MANTNFYYDFNFSLPFVDMILKLLGKKQDTQSQLTDTANREWFSQPRLSTTGTTECVTVTFRLPLSVSEISTEVLRMPCAMEMWYQDRSNNWRPVLDMQRIPLRVNVAMSDTKSWYKYSGKCYPIVAKKFQFRINRTADPSVDGTPFPVGLRNTLIRRNVYDRQSGTSFEDEVDIMGNVVSKYIKDWDATRAADDNYLTFWKSAPQPDPAAVVSLYLDVRDDTGGPQIIDKVYIDPVYTGQHVNLYYSSDTLTGTRFLSPITLGPKTITSETGTVTGSTSITMTDSKKNWTVNQWVGYYLFTSDNATLQITENTSTALTFASGSAPSTNTSYSIGMPSVINMENRESRGLYDTLSPGSTDDSFYSFPLGVGLQERHDAWIGVEWRPGFDAANIELNNNPVLFQADQTDVATTPKPKLYYEPENRVFVLQLDADHIYTSDAINQEFTAGDSLKVVAGWRYGVNEDGSDQVYISVIDQRKREIVLLEQSASLPDKISFDGVASFENIRGTIVNAVVKLEGYQTSSEGFQQNPTYYCDPDPVIADDAGNRPSTTLDNAIYVAPFISREHGSGGSDSSHFEDKEWTPIWRNYTATRGMLHLPQPISMKYLKMEFTNLTEEPYPVYEAGVETKYQVYPISVIQQSSIGPKLYTGEGGFLGLGTFISVNGARSVNWLNPMSVLSAIGSVITPQVPPVIINTGLPYISDSLPNGGISSVEQSRRIEAASSYVYARDAISPYVMAQDQYNTIIKAEGLQAIQPYVDVPWKDIEAANPGSVTKVRSTGTVPIRGTDWWIYPGQQLKVPASVMKKITDTSTVTERKLTLENRVRFNTSQVHRYEYRTLKRDAAIAYFAGVREVQPYTSTYVTGEDKPVFKFPSYNSTQWTFAADTIRQSDKGPISARYANVPGVLSRTFKTQSDFVKVNLEFQDSGMIRSNAMWADIDQTVPSIDDYKLSPYFNVIPDNIPTGNWKDPRSTWRDPETVWGAAHGLVAINVDEDRRYQGKRVVHFTREGGQEGEAGISLDQWTNFVPGAQFRMGAVFYRPARTDNDIYLTLTRSDGLIVHREALDFAPTGRWFERTTQFVEIPETLPYATFEGGLQGWIPGGLGTWRAEDTVGRSGTDSARVDTEGGRSTLTSERMQCLTDTTVSASAWVKWADLATDATGPVISLQVLFYDADDELLAIDPVEQGESSLTPRTATQSAWQPLSASVEVPGGQGVTQVAFRLVVEASAGSGGKVWVDDFAVDVPGAPRQQYTTALTLVGDKEEELYISDLYTEISPIRYFAQFGVVEGGVVPGQTVNDEDVSWDDFIEVTDLRYTKDVAIVTSSQPANALNVQAVIASQRAWAFGATITPAYLK